MRCCFGDEQPSFDGGGERHGLVWCVSSSPTWFAHAHTPSPHMLALHGYLYIWNRRQNITCRLTTTPTPRPAPPTAPSHPHPLPHATAPPQVDALPAPDAVYTVAATLGCVANSPLAVVPMPINIGVGMVRYPSLLFRVRTAPLRSQHSVWLTFAIAALPQVPLRWTGSPAP